MLPFSQISLQLELGSIGAELSLQGMLQNWPVYGPVSFEEKPVPFSSFSGQQMVKFPHYIRPITSVMLPQMIQAEQEILNRDFVVVALVS